MSRGGDPLHAELLWYYSESAAEMGDRSSYAAMVQAIQVGKEDAGYPSDKTPMSAVMAARRQRRIREALALLGPGQESALRAFYTPERRHSSKHFGDHASVVTMLLSARKAYHETLARPWKGKRRPETLDEWLGELCGCARFKDPDTSISHTSRCGHRLLNALHREASDAVREARASFAQAWEDTRPVVRRG